MLVKLANVNRQKQDKEVLASQQLLAERLQLDMQQIDRLFAKVQSKSKLDLFQERFGSSDKQLKDVFLQRPVIFLGDGQICTLDEGAVFSKRKVGCLQETNYRRLFWKARKLLSTYFVKTLEPKIIWLKERFGVHQAQLSKIIAAFGPIQCGEQRYVGWKQGVDSIKLTWPR